jgi:hypothetical protein
LQALETRLGETEQRRKRAIARIQGARPRRSAVERARDLVGGGRIESSSAADEIAATNKEYAVLRDAIAAATGRLDEVVIDLSFAASQKVQAQHRAAFAATLQALADLNASLDAAAAIRARLRSLGYVPSGVLLPALEPFGAAALGDPRIMGTEAWRYAERIGGM